MAGKYKISDSLLNAVLGISKGDRYDLDIFKRLKEKQIKLLKGGDISGLYMDDSYLFLRVEPVESFCM